MGAVSSGSSGRSGFDWIIWFNLGVPLSISITREDAEGVWSKATSLRLPAASASSISLNPEEDFLFASSFPTLFTSFSRLLVKIVSAKIQEKVDNNASAEGKEMKRKIEKHKKKIEDALFTEFYCDSIITRFLRHAGVRTDTAIGRKPVQEKPVAGVVGDYWDDIAESRARRGTLEKLPDEVKLTQRQFLDSAVCGGRLFAAGDFRWNVRIDGARIGAGEDPKLPTELKDAEEKRAAEEKKKKASKASGSERKEKQSKESGASPLSAALAGLSSGAPTTVVTDDIPKSLADYEYERRATLMRYRANVAFGSAENSPPAIAANAEASDVNPMSAITSPLESPSVNGGESHSRNSSAQTSATTPGTSGPIRGSMIALNGHRHNSSNHLPAVNTAVLLSAPPSRARAVSSDERRELITYLVRCFDESADDHERLLPTSKVDELIYRWYFPDADEVTALGRCLMEVLAEIEAVPEESEEEAKSDGDNGGEKERQAAPSSTPIAVTVTSITEGKKTSGAVAVDALQHKDVSFPQLITAIQRFSDLSARNHRAERIPLPTAVLATLETAWARLADADLLIRFNSSRMNAVLTYSVLPPRALCDRFRAVLAAPDEALGPDTIRLGTDKRERTVFSSADLVERYRYVESAYPQLFQRQMNIYQAKTSIKARMKRNSVYQKRSAPQPAAADPAATDAAAVIQAVTASSVSASASSPASPAATSSSSGEVPQLALASPSAASAAAGASSSSPRESIPASSSSSSMTPRTRPAAKSVANRMKELLRFNANKSSSKLGEEILNFID